MPAEKQNEIASLLDGLEHIPEDFRFDQKGSWQKLQTSLPSNAKRKRRVLLYAAISIPALIVGSLIFHDTRKIDHEVVATKSGKPNNTRPVQNNIVEKPLPAPVVKHMYAGKDEKQKPIITQNTNVEVKEIIPVIIQSEEQVGALPATDTSVTIATSKPKYKFRIAHINEIDEDPVAPSGYMAQKNLKKPILATMSESQNVNNIKVAQEKKKLISFLPLSTQ